MATDIYELVQQKLAQSQPGRNQFYDPMTDIIMQIPDMIKNQRDVKQVQDRSTLEDLSSLITSSNSLQSLNNVQATINNFTPSNESLNPLHQNLKNTISSKKNK